MNTRTLTIKDWTSTDFSSLSNLTAIYCRLSAEDGNEGESNSIANQRQILGNFALKENLRNPVFFTDDGFSGSNFNRPAITKLLELVDLGKVKTVIVKDLSRLGRDYLRVGRLLESVFPAKNIRFISLNEQVDSLKVSTQDAYMLPLVNIFNEWYSRQCSEKIKLSKHTKAKSGQKIAWQAPYGYIKNPDNCNEWTVDKEASKNIQRVFREFLAGKTPTEIAHELRNDKILTPVHHKRKLGLKGCVTSAGSTYHWRAQMIWAILDREEYTGATVNLKWDKPSHKSKKQLIKPKSEWLVFPDTHEAIIDKETFQTVQKMRSHKRVTQRHQWRDKEGHENTFAGLVYCQNGHKLTFCPQQKGDLNLDHYKCRHYGRIKTTCSHSHYIRKEVLTKLIGDDVRELLAQIALDEGAFAKKLRQRYNVGQNQKLIQSQKTLEELKNRHQQIDQIISNLYEDKISGSLTAERFFKMSEKYEAEQTTLSTEIAHLEREISKQVQTSSNIEKFLKQVRKCTQLETLTPEIVNNLIDKIEVSVISRSKKQIKIYYNFIGEL
ncbi:MAG: recombinase family protein [bacterium]|nr:recombinase family protein [bacterium]